MPKANDSLKAGKWERTKFTGTQLEGKTLGVIGLGRVGLAVAKRAQGFGMTVLGFDPFLAAEKALEYGVESVARLDDLWGRCDFITLHTPMTAETRNLIGAARDRADEAVGPDHQLRPRRPDRRGGPGRGAQERQGRRRGDRRLRARAAAVDHPLVRHPLVVVTPHLGASTEEAQVSVAVEAARLLSDFLTRGQVRFAVNMPALDSAELEDVRLYLNLAWRLGMLHAQMDRGTLKNAKLTYRGEVAHKNTKLITASFAAGLMESALEEQVNLVNAMPSGPRARDRDRGTIRRGARRFRAP